MDRLRLAAAWCLALALSGCDLSPDRELPAVELPPEWSESGEAVAWPAADWWRRFETPALDELIARAYAYNYDLAAAAARVRQADAQVRIAGGRLLPGISASAGTDRRWNGSESGMTVRDGFDLSLAAAYEIDAFGANRNAAEAAEAQALFRRFDREAVALTVVASVASTYFQALHLRDRLGVAQRNLDLAVRVLEIAEARVRNGAASPLELAQQRTAVASQRAVLPSLRAELRQTENALAILVGATPAGAPLARGSIMTVTLPPIEAGLPSGILVRRPDIQAAERRLAAANAEIGVARAALFPDLSLTASYGFASSALGSLLDPASLGTRIAASVVQSIFSGGALEGGVELARERYVELAESYRHTILVALGDVDDALVVARRAAEREVAEMVAVAEAQEAFRLAEIRYRAGEVDLLTVLDAQRSLFQTEDRLVQTRLERLQAAVSLYRALGGGWQLSEPSLQAVP